MSPEGAAAAAPPVARRGAHHDAQFFATYFAQGVQRVGKDYLRHQAGPALRGDTAAMQLFYNLLPEFGSLPWALKPALVYLAERALGPAGRQTLTALCGMLTGAVWLHIGASGTQGSEFLLCTALVSLGSAMVDGLIDGRVAEESADAETAASCRYLCETGQFAGGLLVGTAAWFFSFGPRSMLLLLAVAWVLVAPCVGLAPLPASAGAAAPAAAPAASQGGPGAAKAGGDRGGPAKNDGGGGGGPVKSEAPSGVRGLLRAIANRSTAATAALSFAICLSPTLDFFLFRQHSLGLQASQQTLVSLSGSFGWFLGTSAYKQVLAVGRPAHMSLRTCLLLWPLGLLASVAVAVIAKSGSSLTLPLAAAEKAAAECCKALTFMPCTVLMQLHAPRGCEGTAFALMQWSGTIGQVLSRNVEYALMALAGASVSLGFSTFWQAAAAAAAWRVITAATLLAVLPLVPELGETEGDRKAA